MICPIRIRMSNKRDFIFQGNTTNNPGSTTTEQGLYNANAIDGLRSVMGSVAGFTTNNAIQADVSTLNILESLQLVSARAANNGGAPSAVFMSMNAKQALDTEQQSNQRYNNDFVEIVPGVRVNQVNWANGSLAIIPVPGNMIGTYNRTSDGQLVEDMYVLDERTVTIRWLYSETFTVLQIPSGVDGFLSNRFNEMEPSASNCCRIITLISVNTPTICYVMSGQRRGKGPTVLPVETERVTPQCG